VRNSEKELMHKNVLDHEPEIALFVEDEDPLLFYHAILKFSLLHLNINGSVYFEINEAFEKEMIALCQKMGFKETVIRKDIHNKARMLKTNFKQ
jgi:release factor glutamine methyltransferase